VEEARINALQHQKEAQIVLKKGKEANVPDIRMNAALAARPTMTAGKSAVELVIQVREAKVLRMTVVMIAVPDQVVEAKTVSPKAKHAQKSALRAVRVNAGPAPVVEKKDQKDHLHELAKGHLHQEGPARVKLPVVVVAHARPPERKMANIANAQLQRNSVRIDHAPPVMHVPPAEA